MFVHFYLKQSFSLVESKHQNKGGVYNGDVNNVRKYSKHSVFAWMPKIKKNEIQRLRLVVRLNSRCAVHEFESCPSAHVEYIFYNSVITQTSFGSYLYVCLTV